jgi:hypothetical protein
MAARNSTQLFFASAHRDSFISALETLVVLTLRASNCRLLRIESATNEKPMPVFFTSALGRPTCVLPVVELNQRNIRAELVRVCVEPVAVERAE